MTISLIASASYRDAAQRLADIMTAEDSTSEQLSDGIEQLASAVADEVIPVGTEVTVDQSEGVHVHVVRS